MQTRAGPLGLRPGAPLRGTLGSPGSKSIAQRALLAAALARGRTRLEGLPGGADVCAALDLVGALGCGVRGDTERAVEIDGLPPAAGGLRVRGTLRCGESGTLARLATAACALGAAPGVPLRIEVSGTLLRRSSAPLFDALRGAGVRIAGSRWPAEFEPVPAPVRARLVDPVSSQEVSALLLALGAWPGERTLEVSGEIPSRPYVDLTLGVLGRFALQSRVAAPQGRAVFNVRGPLTAPGEPLRVEPDASLAAVALAAGCLSDGEVRVPGLGAGSLQGDVRIVEHLSAFGCACEATAGELRARGMPVQAAVVDLRGEPDLAPVLAIVAAAAALRAPAEAAWSELRGLGTLPGKESSRIEVLARGLEACGWQVEAQGDLLRVGPPRGPAPPAVLLDPHSDHRMAFAFALLGLLRDGVSVSDPGCVAKSWPRFWEDLGALGAVVRQG